MLRFIVLVKYPMIWLKNSKRLMESRSFQLWLPFLKIQYQESQHTAAQPLPISWMELPMNWLNHSLVKFPKNLDCWWRMVSQFRKRTVWLPLPLLSSSWRRSSTATSKNHSNYFFPVWMKIRVQNIGNWELNALRPSLLSRAPLARMSS